MPLMKVQFPSAGRDFLPRVNFHSADSVLVSVHPHVQSHALVSVHMIKIL